MNATEPVLCLNDVQTNEGTDVSLQIAPGQFAVLAGPSGAEKSELLLMAAGLRKPRQGSVRLLGADFASQHSTGRFNLRRRSGFVFQEPIFIQELSSIENIQLPLRYDDLLSNEEVTRHTLNILLAAGLTGDMRRVPDELAPVERRRLGLARAWIREPEIVFYDEPAKGLDPASQQKIYGTIHNYHNDRKKDGRPSAALLACNNPQWVLDLADLYLVLVGGHFTSKADQTNIRGRRIALEKEFLDSIQAI
jgi:ABC-type transporter Mla maintaining outer membrane lipid asymmetry ATPase subunit MlaF